MKLKSFLKILASAAVIAVLAAYPINAASGISKNNHISHSDTGEGIAVLDMLAGRSPGDAQKSIDELYRQKQLVTDRNNLKNKIESSIRKIENGELTYREVFRDVYIAGDSLMAGLSAYGITSSNHLMAKVSASVHDIGRNMKKISSAKPRILIMHYGLNGISTNDNSNQEYIDEYRGYIKRIKAASPDTRVVVSLLFPVDPDIAKNKKFEHIDTFNEMLINMCKEEQAEYLDSSEIVRSNTQYYRDDGIHFNKEFYINCWAKHVMREMEIY